MTTPVIAACLCFLSLFILQNVFNQEVYREVRYELTGAVHGPPDREGTGRWRISEARSRACRSTPRSTLRDAVEERTEMTRHQERVLLDTAKVFHTSFFPTRKIAQLTHRGVLAGSDRGAGDHLRAVVPPQVAGRSKPSPPPTSEWRQQARHQDQQALQQDHQTKTRYPVPRLRNRGIGGQAPRTGAERPQEVRWRSQ